MSPLGTIVIYLTLLVQFLGIILSTYWIVMGILYRLHRLPPFVPVADQVLPSIIQTLNLRPESKLYDLGCGNGKVLRTAAKATPQINPIRNSRGVFLSPGQLGSFNPAASGRGISNGMNCTGIEIDWFPYLIARILCHKNPNISLIRDNFFQTNLSSATHIFTFLLPRTMDKLLPKLEHELRPGTRLVSCDFKFSNKKAIQIIDLHREKNNLCRFLYVYEFY